MSSSSPFPFLDLPKEIRLIVYEHISMGVKAHVIQGYILLLASTSVSILAVSPEVHDESSAIVSKKLAKLEAIPLRLHTSALSVQQLSSHGGLLAQMGKYMSRISRPVSASLALWSREGLLDAIDPGT
jgi:hypothetical protein